MHRFMMCHRNMWLAKMTSSVSFQFYKINCGFGCSVRFFALCIVECVFMPLQYHARNDVYFHAAELLQVINGMSDAELEVQRYGVKKSTLTVDPVMLEDEFII